MSRCGLKLPHVVTVQCNFLVLFLYSGLSRTLFSFLKKTWQESKQTQYIVNHNNKTEVLPQLLLFNHFLLLDLLLEFGINLPLIAPHKVFINYPTAGEIKDEEWEDCQRFRY